MKLIFIIFLMLLAPSCVEVEKKEEHVNYDIRVFNRTGKILENVRVNSNGESFKFGFVSPKIEASILASEVAISGADFTLSYRGKDGIKTLRKIPFKENHNGKVIVIVVEEEEALVRVLSKDKAKVYMDKLSEEAKAQ